ncbi:hypothetical protein SY88_18585 [Clostridiales bacterium PH28_bin88]|nr:hypothetical protein SY88_18585 [Clostridiales bacterium PH28_bin88]
MTLKVLLADDEAGVLALLESILRELPDVLVVAKAQTVQETVRKAMKNEPDVAFLDIQFPDGSGIELATELRAIDPDLDVIFVTAHSDFTLEAFQLYSYDYILKPIDENRVIQTVKRLKKERDAFIDQSSLLVEKLNTPRRLAIKQGQDILLIDPAKIMFLERVDNKVLIHCTDCSYETAGPLHELEARLGQGFFRSHRSYIINLEHVEKIVSLNDNTYQILFGKKSKEAFLSRRRVADLLERLPSLEKKEK